MKGKRNPTEQPSCPGFLQPPALLSGPSARRDRPKGPYSRYASAMVPTGPEEPPGYRLQLASSAPALANKQ